MNAHVYLVYLVTWTLVALTPGPAVLCSMTFATRYGFRRALAGIGGIQLGHFVFFGCVASGLAALLETASTTFAIIRWIGALYLLYLGVRIIISTFRRSACGAEPLSVGVGLGQGRWQSRRSLILQGFAIQVTNPKALLFMSALLPQFIQPNQALFGQLCVLLTITIAVDLLVLSAYAILAIRGAQSFRSSRTGAWLERVFGAALIFFGVRLIVATRK